jgi:putative redox protein
MPRVAHTVLTSTAGYAAQLRTGHHHLVADEPQALGGTDTGPAPYQLVLSGLAACTAITLRMYAERKQWALGTIEVDAELLKDTDDSPGRVVRVVTFSEKLTDAQRSKLAEIVEKTPVTKTLRAGMPIETTFKMPST